MTAVEAEAGTNLLREYELRLLRCSIPPPSPPSYHQSADSLHKLIENVLSSIETGDYAGALSSDAVRTVFKSPESLSVPMVDTPDFFHSDVLLRGVDSFVLENAEDTDYRAFLVMAIAVAALLAFTQRNVTGPIEKLPPSPLSTFGYGGEDAEWEGWARNQLMAAGSDLLGKFYNLQYIVFSKILLVRLKDLSSEGKVFSMDQMRSMPWWLARLLFLQQRILDERSSSLFDLLQVYSHEALRCFSTSEAVASYWGYVLQKEEASTIVSMLHLEVGIMEHAYGRVDSSRLHFQSAEVASGLQLSVTGAMGFRTVHQVEPKAQLLLVANTSASNESVGLPSATPELQNNASSDGGDNVIRRQEADQTSDILMTPKFVKDDKCSENGVQDNGNGGKEPAPLRAIHQEVILAQCLYIEKSTAHDEMQRWEMAPYIEAIDSQPSSDFIVRCFCDILRVRWESTRSHTKERALAMMEKVVQNIYESSPSAAKRIHFFFGAYVSSIPALRKEYGELLVSCGLIGEALTTFEDLELWDNLIFCYRLLGKKAAAVELINKRLSDMPNDPRLWCSLGDVTNDDACFEKALEVSANRSARAKRSLARSAYNRGDYEKSQILWESAMALNSLYPDGWFALGAAALKARDVDKALEAFTSAVQFDPDNGEAWNNIACLHMIKKKNKEAFIAFKEALKFKRNNWQLWENFSHVAADVSNFSQALQATQMVLDLSNNKRTDAQLLERVMVELEGRFTRHSQSHGAANNHRGDVEIHQDDPAHSDLCSAENRETNNLMELLGKILQKIVCNTGEGDIWGLYARWHKLKGDLTMCSEALLKQVRSYQGSDLWKEIDRFKKFASASLELCKVYMELSSSTGSRRELHAAEMHLKNTIKQAGNFTDSKELRDLEACLTEVQMKLQATP